MRSSRRLVVLCIFLAVTVPTQDLWAQWIPDGAPICTEDGDQIHTQIISDGVGGALIVWDDDRGLNDDIYIQRLDPSGIALWTLGGVCICAGADRQIVPQLVSDGAGGAIVTWIDSRNGSDDIYAQRVDASGTALWITDGVPLCSNGWLQTSPQITTDGSGGAIVVWEDFRSGSNCDIYAQRVNATGIIQWTTDGVAVCTSAGHQRYAQLIPDGSGGAIVVWEDLRGGNADIYAQRIDASGAEQWTLMGEAICSLAGEQTSPQIASDGSGGAIVVWEDDRGGGANVYAQRIDAAGDVQWTVNGVALCVEPGVSYGNLYSPQIATDGAGGAIVTWQDWRIAWNWDIYAQRVDASGVVQWTANGVPLTTAPDYQDTPQIVSDGLGGAVVTWESISNSDGYYHIFAQRVSFSGVVHWATDGVAVCTADIYQLESEIAMDGSGGTIIAWRDFRTDDYDIYAQRINAYGEPVATTLQSCSARCTGRSIDITWTLSEIDDDVEFVVRRATGSPDRFIEVESGAVTRNGPTFNFEDVDVEPGTTYWYRVDICRGNEMSKLFETGPVSVPALSLSLFQNHPNPFNPSTTIRFDLPKAASVKLCVYNINGELVSILVDQRMSNGRKVVTWMGKDDRGRAVSSGVYFYRLVAGKFVQTKKMVLLR